MSQSFVYRLEVIQIDIQQRQLFMTLATELIVMLQSLFKTVPVGQPGQAVVPGLMFEQGFAFTLTGNILLNTHKMGAATLLILQWIDRQPVPEGGAILAVVFQYLRHFTLLCQRPAYFVQRRRISVLAT